jgi:carbamoyl-phosphate synthase large subunit
VTARRLTVLVLGVGGNVSQGILKSLHAGSLPCRVLAGCVSPLSAGLYLADRGFISPYAQSPEFLPWLEQTYAEEGVDIVLSGVEPVLEAIAGNPVFSCLVSPPDVLRIGQDKLATARWLAEQGFDAPRSAGADDAEGVARLAEELGFPLVAKPRRGKGSADVALVHDERHLELVRARPDVVVQEHLVGEEYTVGVVCDTDGEPRGSLAMRRELEAGTTYRAEAGDFPEARDYAERIARALGPQGPVNVQLRMVDGRPVAFELNVRFSGTTPLRARLGFNEVEASLRHFALGEPLELPSVTEGLVLRYWNEIYVAPAARAQIEQTGRLDDPRADPATVEDWGLRQ